MAAERQSEAPCGGKARPESIRVALFACMVAARSGLRPAPVAPLRGLCPLRARAAPAPERVGRVGSPRARFPRAPGVRLAPPGVPLPPPPLGSVVVGRGGSCGAPEGGGGCPLWGALRGWGCPPAPVSSPAPLLRFPGCLRCSARLRPYRGETASVSPAPCRARRPVGRHDVIRGRD